jgi:hypothetical protein
LSDSSYTQKYAPQFNYELIQTATKADRRVSCSSVALHFTSPECLIRKHILRKVILIFPKINRCRMGRSCTTSTMPAHATRAHCGPIDRTEMSIDRRNRQQTFGRGRRATTSWPERQHRPACSVAQITAATRASNGRPNYPHRHSMIPATRMIEIGLFVHIHTITRRSRTAIFSARARPAKSCEMIFYFGDTAAAVRIQHGCAINSLRSRRRRR